MPAAFRFAVKLPKTITHERKLVDVAAPLARFADEVGGLAEKRGPVLVQLPPSLAFDPGVATSFFALLAGALIGQIVCEPRHASWFEAEADALLVDHRVARVAADPARVPAAALPGGWRGLTYARWHGSPAVYRSSYDPDAIARHAALAATGESWTIYDNTASGAATANAMALLQLASGEVANPASSAAASS